MKHKIRSRIYIIVSGGCALIYSFNIDYMIVLSKKIAVWSYGGVFMDTVGVIIQSKNNNCGPTALKMIYDRYKINVTMKEMEKNLNLSEKGTSMLSLIQMSIANGLEAEGWRYAPNEYNKINMPAIIYVNKNHFVVADSMGADDYIFIRDPGIGKYKIQIINLLKHWDGEAIIFKTNNTITK